MYINASIQVSKEKFFSYVLRKFLEQGKEELLVALKFFNFLDPRVVSELNVVIGR